MLSLTANTSILSISLPNNNFPVSSYAEKYSLKHIRHILYTPLAQTYLFAPQHALGFIGTSDSWSDTAEIIQLSKTNHIPLIVYEGCNHSLECNDTSKDLENLKDIIQKTIDFCKGCH